MEKMEDTIRLNILEDNQIIKNKELKKFVQYKLDKNEFNKEDLLNIEDIILDGKTITEDINKIYFDEINLFKNLKKIKISNVNISNEELEEIKNIEEICFKKCRIESIKKLGGIKKLSINNSKITNFDDIKSLTNLSELELINVKIDKFDFLREFLNLKKLAIKNVNNFSMDKIDFKLPIEYLSLDNIQNIDYAILESYSNLKTLSIEKEKVSEWEEILDKLKEKNIKILLDDIYEY